MKIIARVRTELTTKFGLPRQSNVVPELKGRIVFEPEYRNSDALRGLEEYSHIWIIWQFSENVREDWSPTVRPPVLGGNTRVGVFATRSSFRPNQIAISCVKLENIEIDAKDGPVINISGIDMMDGTPVFDIKPYIPKWDSIPEANNGFTGENEKKLLRVEIAGNILNDCCKKNKIGELSEKSEDITAGRFSEEQLSALIKILEQDPRPAYKAGKNDPDRVYGFEFAGEEVKFTVDGDILKVIEITDGGK